MHLPSWEPFSGAHFGCVPVESSCEAPIIAPWQQCSSICRIPPTGTSWMKAGSPEARRSSVKGPSTAGAKDEPREGGDRGSAILRGAGPMRNWEGRRRGKPFHRSICLLVARQNREGKARRECEGVVGRNQGGRGTDPCSALGVSGA